VFQNPGLARALCRNGRATLEEYYDWKKIYPLWDQIYT
jgi:hypothetical protein